jgi:hypothetical protein
MEAGRQGVCT